MKSNKNCKKYYVGLIVILFSLLSIVVLLNISNAQYIDHIERVSKECASEGYGIKLQYTSSGDEYYVCNK